MSKVAGQLLWSRRQITLVSGSGAPNIIDTGICQKSLAFGTDPVLNGVEPSMGDQDGTPSRVQVIPLAPLTGGMTPGRWDNVSHSEPYVLNGTVHVHFTVSSELGTTINVLFWDPHSILGPGEAETYNTYNPN